MQKLSIALALSLFSFASYIRADTLPIVNISDYCYCTQNRDTQSAPICQRGSANAIFVIMKDDTGSDVTYLNPHQIADAPIFYTNISTPPSPAIGIRLPGPLSVSPAGTIRTGANANWGTMYAVLNYSTYSININGKPQVFKKTSPLLMYASNVQACLDSSPASHD